jgi:acyl carrier protein
MLIRTGARNPRPYGLLYRALLMRTEDFLEAMLSICPSIEEAAQKLDQPVETLNIDSFDLEVLRTTLEKKLGRRVDDKLWLTAPTFRVLMEGL